MKKRLIDAIALLQDFKDRALKARQWKEGAILNGNEEAAIRADAVLSFLTEVKLTIEKAPTVTYETARPGSPVYCNLTSRLYVIDKHDGRIHRIGDEPHDALWVTNEGEIHYHNLQNGDGGTTEDKEDYGYVILITDDGMLGSKELARHGFAPDERFIDQIEKYNAEKEKE